MDADADRRGQRTAAAHAGQGAYTLTADAAPTEPDEMQGMLRVYKLRPIALTLTDNSGNHAALSVSYGADNLAVLQSWGFDCRSAVSRRTSLRKPSRLP